ncbi:restriction endonuclease subunit S [Empedobacter stercoris]|uniref:restriction endonuclease subunit S n=1 Tax=Empedobacter stercoris TaxID=1628248 RepID=UPI001662887C|nr:restriction endonuclease subunit S [Empedobacter stercoris]MCA4809599.1 restriction endonuclease subunit S [Empedobacter stercoris]QNT13523.1 hypothetical protein HNV03_01875 [Empedobacter stercoris]
MEKQLQPKLRFPEFDGDWEKTNIKSATINQNNKRKPLKDSDRVNLEKKYPYYGASGIIDYVDNYLFDGEYLLLGEDGANIISRNSRLVFIAKGKFWVNNHAHIFSAKSNYDIRFLSDRLEHINYVIYNTGTAQPKLNSAVVANIEFNSPSLPEQQKIADYLSTIDEKITLLEEKKTELSRYKKAMMQKLFSQEIRFKDENGNDFSDWEKVQLKDILIEHKEKNKGDKYDEVLSVAKMKGVINQIEHLGRSYSAEKIDHYKVINPFDIVYTKSPTSGFPFGIIKQNKLNRSGVLSPLYAVFKPKTKYLGMILHDIFLSEVETYNYLVPLVQKGAKNTMNINNDEFLKGKKYSLPTSEKEQQKIADFLSAIDESIDKVSEQIKETQSFKKAMLQQMFV